MVEERRVRAAVERRYRLVTELAHLGPERAAEMDVDEHRRAFAVFALGLMGSFERYLDAGDVDLGRDLVGYRSAAMHLTDDEVHALLQDLRDLLAPRLALPASPERRRRVLCTVLLPADRP